MAYAYADTKVKNIDSKIKPNYVYNRRVLCPHNTDNLHEIKVINSLVTLNKEGVVRVQHPTISLIKLRGLDSNEFKEEFESVSDIREGYFGLQREIFR